MPDDDDRFGQGSVSPLPFRPHPGRLAEHIRSLALETRNIRWSEHALEQMLDRGITDLVVVEVLRTGDLRGEMVAGKNAGEWKVKMVKRVKGHREVGVVLIHAAPGKLFLKTVEWEDPR